MPDPASHTGPWEVFVLEYACAAAQPAASLVHGDHAAPPVDVPYAFAAARSPHGVLLIDTGFLADAGGGKLLAETFGVGRWVHPLRMLAALGIGPDDVAAVVVSHAHFDHMGGLALFPRARLFMQKRELFSSIEALALPPRFGFLAESIDPADLHAALSAAAEHRLTLLDGDRDNLLPGAHARLAADSHTLGSQWVALDTPTGRIAVAGDCIYSFRNLAGSRFMPLGYATGSAWGQLQAMERISSDVGGDLGRIVLLHDVGRWAGGVVVAEVEGMRVVRVG